MQKLFFSFLCLLTTFSVSGQRIVHSLNPAWSFTLKNNPSEVQIINIPHTWNSKDAFEDGVKYYHGTGIYQKTIFIPDEWYNKSVFIKFEGANQVCKLWVNNVLAGEHIGGYTGFVFDISTLVKYGQNNHLKVECNNQHNADIPPLEADFNFYGGIYRDVYLIATNAIHFEVNNESTGRFFIKTSDVSKSRARINIHGRIINGTTQTKKCKLQVNIFEPSGKLEKKLEKLINLKANDSELYNFDFQIDTPELWSPEKPSLYTAELTIFDEETDLELDKLTDKFGCRWFKMDPQKGFFLNGKHYKLIGVNRHQDFEGLGNALPNSLHQNDYRKIKEMGANFVRISHYPHDPEAYRLCDELGLLVWSEIPVINEVTKSDAFLKNCLQMQREQIFQFYNHPSVIMWGYMNEIFLRMVFNKNLSATDKKEITENTLKIAQKLNNETKKLDPSRLTVMALHNNQVYNQTGVADIPDVIGWNLYFGWYDKGLENLGKFLDEEHKKYPNRPLVISEYGPGADTRIQTENPKPWDYSEAYQLKSHVSYYKQIMERPFIAGMAAWNFADFGSSERQDAQPYVNQKGLLNFDRTAKDIYHYYQSLLLKELFVYITGKHFNNKYLADNGDGKGTLKVSVFSNEKKVELSINDSLKRTVDVLDNIAETNFHLPEGEYLVKAEAGTANHQRIFNLLLRSNLLSQLDWKTLCINVGTHCDYSDPLTNEIWISEQPYKKDSWGYIGGNEYQKSKDKYQGTPINILGTQNDPLYQTMREDIDAYRFDLEKGKYRVTLLFAEPDQNTSESIIYNLGDSDLNQQEHFRAFSIKINGQKVIHKLNLSRDYGSGRAVELMFESYADNGLLIEFEKIVGKTILSGIKLEKI